MANNTNPVQDSQNPHEQPQETSTPHGSRAASRDRFILINPFTQGMVVIEGNSSSSSSLESWLRDLFISKDSQPPASKASIEAMPSVELCEDDGDGEGECVICLEEWRVGDQMVKEMPCMHKFHGECVENWLNIHGSCPVCRYKMPTDDDDDDDNKKGDEDQNRGRRRDIWVSFSFTRDGRSLVIHENI